MRALAILCASALFVTLAFIGFGRPLGFQWDFFVFYNAALSWRLGLSPYDFTELAGKAGLAIPPSMSFTYPAHTLPLFVPYSYLPQSLAAGAWLLTKGGFLALLLWACRGVHRFRGESLSDMALLLFGFNATLLWDFTSGNTSLLQFALVWLAFACLERGRDYSFGILLALAASFKIQPIALAAAPLLIYARPRWKAAASALFAFAAFAAANACLFPDFSARFLQEALSRIQLESGILAPSAIGLARDVAAQLGLISVLPEFVRALAPLVAMPLYFLVVLFVGASTCFALKRTSLAHRPAEGWGFLLLAYLLTVPRVKSYEFLLVLPVAAYVLGQIGARWKTALLLFLCLPVVFPISAEKVVEIYSSPQLGSIKKVEYLFYQYLPYWGVLVLWLWFFRRSLQWREGRGMYSRGRPS